MAVMQIGSGPLADKRVGKGRYLATVDAVAVDGFDAASSVRDIGGRDAELL